MKKIILNINPPRSGGKALMLLDCFKKSQNLLIWPCEFHYFRMFRQATNNKNIEKLHKLNSFFITNHFNKLFLYLINNNISLLDIDKFKRSLNKQQNEEMNVFQYLNFIFSCYNDSSIQKKKFDDIDYFLMNITARGFDWELNNENIFFLKTNRNLKDSFKSIKNKNLESLPIENFFLLSGKKSFFYWLYTYREMVKKIDNISKKKVISLHFEDIRYNLSQTRKIQSENCKIIRNFFDLKILKDNSNDYYSINRKKIKKDFKFTKIENYCLDKLIIQDKKIDILDYLKNLFFLIFELKIKNRNIFIIFYKYLKIIVNFLYFLYIYKNDKNFLKTLSKNNHDLKFQTLFRN